MENQNIKWYPGTLFHGTSAHLLPMIKEHGLGGKNIMQDWKVMSFLKWAYPYIKYDEYDYSYHHHSELSLIKASITENRNPQAMNFEYGDLYVVGGRQKAESYAKTAPELLCFVKNLIDIAEEQNVLIIKEELQNFSKIMNFISLPPKPIVIELPRVLMKDLEDENGGSPYTMVMPNLNPEVQNVILDQEAFRLKKTIPFSEITKIYDLSI